MSVRLLHFLVQPVVVVDDGSNLTAGPTIQASTLSLDALRDLVEQWPTHLATIAEQIEPPAETDSESAEPTSA